MVGSNPPGTWLKLSFGTMKNARENYSRGFSQFHWPVQQFLGLSGVYSRKANAQFVIWHAWPRAMHFLKHSFLELKKHASSWIFMIWPLKKLHKYREWNLNKSWLNFINPLTRAILNVRKRETMYKKQRFRILYTTYYKCLTVIDFALYNSFVWINLLVR